ncbi:hypothetical protein [Streptomyces sp. NPDC127105]|uniref:hypothetical protein n=1 Tax=Streptomyces sp. NPDC127105 TaxID=3345359 RepID=UPI00366635D5
MRLGDDIDAQMRPREGSTVNASGNMGDDQQHEAERINRFGEQSTHELGIQPEAYDPKLDVDFTPLHEQNPAAGFGTAA